MHASYETLCETLASREPGEEQMNRDFVRNSILRAREERQQRFEGAIITARHHAPSSETTGFWKRVWNHIIHT